MLAMRKARQMITTRRAPSSSAAPAKPSSSPITAKMKSVWWAGRKLRCVCVPLHEPLAAEHAARDGDLALRELVAGRRGVVFGVEEDEETLHLVGLEQADTEGRRQAPATRPPTATTRPGHQTPPGAATGCPTPAASRRRMTPNTSAVPRSGCEEDQERRHHARSPRPGGRSGTGARSSTPSARNAPEAHDRAAPLPTPTTAGAGRAGRSSVWRPLLRLRSQ